jgi:hypothetical protein
MYSFMFSLSMRTSDGTGAPSPKLVHGSAAAANGERAASHERARKCVPCFCTCAARAHVLCAPAWRHRVRARTARATARVRVAPRRRDAPDELDKRPLGQLAAALAVILALLSGMPDLTLSFAEAISQGVWCQTRPDVQRAYRDDVRAPAE